MSLFSIRDWQKAALIRILTHSSSLSGSGGGVSADGSDGAGSSGTGLLDTTWSDDWKVLLYDAHTKAILSPLLTVAELRACGVTLHLPLESPRDAIPDVSAVYFISPAPTSVRLLADDAATGRYRDASIFVTPSLPRPQLESLAASCVASGSVPRISRLMDSYASFVALQPRLFTSVGLPSSFAAYASPSAGEEEVGAYAQSVASSLVSLCATVGITPLIVCSRGGPAEMVARQLEGTLRDHLASPTAPLFASNANAAAGGSGSGSDGFGGGGEGGFGLGGGAGGGAAAQEALIRSLLHGRRPGSLGVGPGSRPVLILLDRTVDLATPLAHASTYEALVDDCVGPIEGNRVQVAAPKGGTGGSGGSDAAAAAGGGIAAAVSLPDLDPFHPAHAAAAGGAAAGAGGGAAGAGAWLMEWASGKTGLGGASAAGGADGSSSGGAASGGGGKTFTLDTDSDPFWAAYCRTLFPDAIEAHERELGAVVAKEREIRRRTGGGAGLAAGAGGGLDALDALADDAAAETGLGGEGGGEGGGSLSSAIESLPALLKRKRVLEVHTHLLHAVMARVAARMVPHLYEAELPLLQNPYGSAAALGHTDRPGVHAALRDASKGTALDRLRLAAVYLLSVSPQSLAGAGAGSAGGGAGAAGASGGAASAAIGEETEALLAALAAACPAPAYAAYAAAVLHYIRSLRTSPSLLSAAAPHLVTMAGLGGGGAGGGGGGGVGGAIGAAAGGLFANLLNRAAAQVSRLVSNETRLPVTAITAAICDGKPAAAAPFAVDSYLVCDPKAPAGPGERTFGSYVAAVNAAYSASGGGSGGGAFGSPLPAGAAGTGAGGVVSGFSPASFRNAFVYMVGGASHVEEADLQAWAAGGAGSGGAAGGAGGGASAGAASGAPSRTVVYGGTELVSPLAFLSQLRDLGQGLVPQPPPAAAAATSASGSAAAAAFRR